MQTQFNPHDIADQCLALVTGDDRGYAHNIVHENGQIVVGVVKSFSNHFKGRLKLHMWHGRYATWRLPQHVIDIVSSLIQVEGNDAKPAPKGWTHV